MKANELRIGNYVIQDVEFIRGISSMSLHKFNLDLIKLIPIPLTEEWLLNFGFKQTNESEDVEWYNINGFEIAIDEEDGQVYFVYQHMVLRHILYVHQLQNLYFALTNEELKII